MTRVQVSQQTIAELRALAMEAELCDEHGDVFGRYVPETATEGFPEGYLPDDISEEELRERSQEPGGSSLAEIWQRLGRK